MDPEIVAQDAEMKKLEKDLEENSNEIKNTSEEIKKQSAKIERIEDIDEKDRTDGQKQDLTVWRKRVEQLGEKEKDLREKEKDLRKEKERLNEKLDKLKAKQEEAGPSTKKPRIENTLDFLDSLDKSLIPDKIELPTYKDTGVPMLKGKPYLLCHNLKERLTEFKIDSSGLAGKECFVFPAASGSGKTRTIYEHLAENWGFYFVVSTRGNAGSADFNDFVDRSERFPGTLKDNLDHLIQCRYGVLQWVKKKHPKLTPLQWLYLQLFPWTFFGRDIFGDTFRKPTSELDVSGIFTIVIDEAQSLIEIPKVPQFFSKTKKNEKGEFIPRPILTPIVRHIGERFALILAGTSVKMKDVMEIVVSGRAVATEYLEFKIYKNEDDVWDGYAKNFLSGAKDQFINGGYAKLLFGRARFLQYFCEHYLTLKGPEDDDGKIKVNLEKSWNYTLESYYNAANATLVDAALELDLSTLVQKFHFNGACPMTIQNSARRLVSVGLAPISRDFYRTPESEDDIRFFEIFEVPVIEALTRLYLQPQYTLSGISAGGSGSAKGFNFEDYIIYCLSQLQKSVSMLDWLSFQDDDEKATAKSKIEKWGETITFSHQRKAGTPLVTFCKTLDQLTLFTQNPEATILRPPNSAGGDIMMKAKLGENPISVFVQCKLWTADPSGGVPKAIKEAVIKTSPAAVLEKLVAGEKEKVEGETSTAAATREKNLKEKLQRLTDSLTNKGCLRLVVVATTISPNVFDNPKYEFKYQVDGEDLIIFLNQATISKISPNPIKWEAAWAKLAESTKR